MAILLAYVIATSKTSRSNQAVVDVTSSLVILVITACPAS